MEGQIRTCHTKLIIAEYDPSYSFSDFCLQKHASGGLQEGARGHDPLHPCHRHGASQ